MRRVVLQDGRVFEGTPLQIVTQMKRIAFFVEEMDLAAYIDWVARNVGDLHGTVIDVRGETVEERAASLLDALIAQGMAVDMTSEGGEMS